LEAVRAVKVRNLSIQRAVLEFNMDYMHQIVIAKSPKYVPSLEHMTIDLCMGLSHFQFYLKLNNLFVQ